MGVYSLEVLYFLGAEGGGGATFLAPRTHRPPPLHSPGAVSDCVRKAYVSVAFNDVWVGETKPISVRAYDRDHIPRGERSNPLRTLT